MSLAGQIGKASHIEASRHISHIAGEVTAHIHHHRHSRLNLGAIATNRERRVEPGATHGKIVWSRSISVVAAQQITHENLHRLPRYTELAEIASKTELTLNFNLQFYVGHTLTINLFDSTIHFSMMDGTFSKHRYFKFSFLRTYTSHHSRAIHYFRIGKHIL